MANLATYIDRTAVTLGAGSWAAATYAALTPSLPTTPDTIIPVLTSVGASTATPGIGALRAAAAANGGGTFIGFGPIVNQASQPAIAADVTSVYWNTLVR